MNGRFAAVPLLLLASVAACGKFEEKEPVGTWIGQSVVLAKPESFREVWTFKDGRITVNDDAENTDEYDVEYAYRIDATKEPKEIDITAQVPGKDKEVRMGIYRIENDTLTIAHHRKEPTSIRPREFHSTTQNQLVVLTFRRKK